MFGWGEGQGIIAFGNQEYVRTHIREARTNTIISLNALQPSGPWGQPARKPDCCLQRWMLYWLYTVVAKPYLVVET